MATRDQVLALLEAGRSYEEAGQALGIPAGQAYLTATGLPAEGGVQHLVGPPAHNPTRKPHVLAWVRERAARELEQTE
jgi:hypothetical protein